MELNHYHQHIIFQNHYDYGYGIVTHRRTLHQAFYGLANEGKHQKAMRNHGNNFL